MKCSKCGYDYPARETKCPYCGEPNKLGMEWEKERNSFLKGKLVFITLLAGIVLLIGTVLALFCK